MEKAKEKFVLRVIGYWQKNTSYLEEANGSGRLNEIYHIKENDTFDPWGHVIQVDHINKDSITLLIDSKKVILKENDRVYIVNKDETSGKNDDFRTDKEYLYVELIDYEKTYYPHLLSFIDKKEKIEENIKTLKVLLKNKYSYFDIKEHLKTILFRLTDKEYLKKINEGKASFLIKERELALPYKDKIIELINDIDIYFKEHTKLLDTILKNNKLDNNEFNYLSDYLYQLAIQYCSYDDIPFDKVSKLCSMVGFRNVEVLKIKIELSKKEMIELCYLLMRINSKSRYYFENFFIANELADELLNIDKNMFDYKTLITFNIDVANYYLQILNRPKAIKYYLNANKIAKENNDLEEAAYALAKCYKLNNSFPEHLKIKVDIESIKQEYKQYSDIIIQAINYKPLMVCEEEFNPLFIKNYFLVMRKVEEIIDKQEDLHIPYQRWDLMQKIYKEEYNIDWKNPKEMNPKVMFD